MWIKVESPGQNAAFPLFVAGVKLRKVTLCSLLSFPFVPLECFSFRFQFWFQLTCRKLHGFTTR